MVALVFFMHVLFATVFPLGRMAVIYAQPIFFTGIRMLIAGVILLSIGYALGHIKRSDARISYREILLLSIFSLFGIFLTNTLELWALQFVPAAKSAFIYSLSPFFAALISYVLFSEKFTLKKLVGMIIGLAGFFIMILFDAPAEIHNGGFGIVSYGELALIGASCATVISWVAARYLVRENNYTSLEISGIGMVWGGGLALVTSFLCESWHPLPIMHMKPFLLCLVAIVVFTNLIAYVLYSILLKTYTVTFLSFAGFVEPIASAVLGWLVLGEVVSWEFYPASLLVFIGLYIFYRQELLQGYVIH